MDRPILLGAHLQVVYYKCVKFHKNPINRLGGVALTRYLDGRKDRVIPIYPPKLCLQGFKKKLDTQLKYYGFKTLTYCPDFPPTISLVAMI